LKYFIDCLMGKPSTTTNDEVAERLLLIRYS